MTLFSWMQRREQGLRPMIGDENYLHKSIYSSFAPYKTWNNDLEGSNNGVYGGVFNLEFSPEGNLLVAACEKKSIVLFDPITTKQTKTIFNAHYDNVNCVKFLDSRMFATCSDDTTVAIWDTRNLKNKIRSLQGHSNWVKNIEYSQKDGLLVTSGFDGSIYTWDINSFTEQGFIYKKVFHTSGLMRCRISPDASKLVICTTGGYLIIIHDLDLTTLAKDLCGFRPNIYRLMQLGRQFIPQAAKFDHVFSKSQKRNRVELVSDFPDHNDAEVLCALQIHPQGWCALSRNISYDEGSEWTCIHDIQEREETFETTGEPQEKECRKKRKYSETDSSTPNLVSRINSSLRSNFESTSSPSTTSDTPESARNSPSNRSEPFVPDIWAAEVTVEDRACRTHRGSRNSNTTNTYAYVYAISSGVTPPSAANTSTNSSQRDNSSSSSPAAERTTSSSSSSSSDSSTNSQRVRDDINYIRDQVRDSYRSIYKSICNRQIYQNVRRLLYYIEEPNKGKGFIKEPSFSADGRIICSPYGFGVRLLAFSPECSDLPEALYTSKKPPQPLKDIKHINCHKDIVVSTKFSPRYPLLVTGCLKGSVVWHHPDF